MSWLRDNCPRLALARDQFLREKRRREIRYMQLVDDRLRAERLVSHRDLQLIRSYQRRDLRYIKRRQDKLDSAKRLLERVNAELREL